MMHVLEMDIGNTRAKWRVVDAAGKSISRGDWPHSAVQLPLDAELDNMLNAADVERIKVASVANDTINQRLQKWAAARKLVIQFAQTSATCAGVSNSYLEPERMGVDRWLAVLAAFNQYPGNTCVVDCGTALKFEVISAAGKHLGGLIMPGMRLQQKALRQHTAKIKFTAQAETDTLQLGKDTASCVQNGSKFMLVGAVHEVLRHAEEQLGSNVQCLISGGDAALLTPLLQTVLRETVIAAPDIVLDGLQYALP